MTPSKNKGSNIGWPGLIWLIVFLILIVGRGQVLYLILFVVSFCFLHWLLFKDREKTPKRQQSSAVDRDYKLRAEYESKFKKPSRPEYMPKALKAKLKTRKLEAH